MWLSTPCIICSVHDIVRNAEIKQLVGFYVKSMAATVNCYYHARYHRFQGVLSPDSEDEDAKGFALNVRTYASICRYVTEVGKSFGIGPERSLLNTVYIATF